MTEKWMMQSDVLSIPEKDLPMIVLSDNIRSFFSWGIKAHEKGSYNHLMWMHRPGYFASQDSIFKETRVDEYLKGSHRLKFWRINTSAAKKYIIKSLIDKDLALPWYRRLYDPLQIVGMAINIPSLQIPWLDICSDKTKFIRKIDPIFDKEVPNHPSPTVINMYLNTRPNDFSVYGRYVFD